MSWEQWWEIRKMDMKIGAVIAAVMLVGYGIYFLATWIKRRKR